MTITSRAVFGYQPKESFQEDNYEMIHNCFLLIAWNCFETDNQQWTQYETVQYIFLFSPKTFTWFQ